MARICFISLNAAGAIRRIANSHIGGVERQTELMARWLVEQGHEVCVIAWGSQDTKQETNEFGVRLLRICERSKGVRLLRFFHPRWTSLIEAMRRADADVYFHNTAEAMTGKIGIWCKYNRRRFVYSVASEPACEKALPTIETRLEKWMYRIGLKSASTVIVQTSTQQQKLKSEFRRESVVLPMPCDPPRQSASGREGAKSRPTVVWIGRIVPLKRLELLLEVAVRMNGIDFEVIGGVNESSPYAQKMLRQAAEIENVTIVGAVPFHETWGYYDRANVLLCTSAYEGFPNTFLEAMAYGVPIVSTFDPGGILNLFGIGVSVAQADEIVDAIQALTSQASLSAQISEKARQYFSQNHAISVAMPKFEKTIVGGSHCRRPEKDA